MLENKVLRKERVYESSINADLFYVDDRKLPELTLMQDMFEVAQEKGATHFEMGIDKDWDDNVEAYRFDFYKIWKETDEERIAREEREAFERMEREQLAKEQKEKQERETLRRLKEKYEGNNQ